MTNDELKDRLVTHIINTLPFHKTVELIRDFAQAVADANLQEMTDEQRVELISQLTGDTEDTQPQEEKEV